MAPGLLNGLLAMHIPYDLEFVTKRPTAEAVAVNPAAWRSERSRQPDVLDLFLRWVLRVIRSIESRSR